MKRFVIVTGVVVVAGVALSLIPTLNTTGLIPLFMAVALTAIAVWAAVELTKLGRDEQYAHVVPGEAPLPGDPTVVKHQEITDAPVRFTPPKSVPPRLVGAIVRERSAGEDLVATIISMAVRGHIRIAVGTRSKEVFFSATSADPCVLDPFELQIYRLMFRTGTTLSRAELVKSGFFTADFKLLSLAAQQEFEAQKWYRGDPQSIVSFMRWVGTIVAVVGSVVMLILSAILSSHGLPGYGWLALPCLVLGVGMVLIAKKMPSRTLAGSMIAIQAFGFKKYLETAEAGQLRWEEGHDIYSEYLPYAIVFGCAKRWTALFEQLAAAGVPLPKPGWLTGASMTLEAVGTVAEAFADIMSLLDGLASVADGIDGLLSAGEFIGGVAGVIGSLGEI